MSLKVVAAQQHHRILFFGHSASKRVSTDGILCSRKYDDLRLEIDQYGKPNSKFSLSSIVLENGTAREYGRGMLHLHHGILSWKRDSVLYKTLYYMNLEKQKGKT